MTTGTLANAADAANPAEVMQDVMAYATAGRSPEEQDDIVRLIKETAREWAVYNFSSGCEVADMLLERVKRSDTVAAISTIANSRIGRARRAWNWRS